MKIITIRSDNPITRNKQLVSVVGGKKKLKKIKKTSLGRHHSEYKSITIYQEPTNYKFEKELPFDPNILKDMVGSYEMDVIDEEDIYEAGEEEVELIRQLYNNINKLTKIQQKVLNLLLEGKSFMEISKETGLGISTVRSSILGHVPDGKKHKTAYGGAIRALRKLMQPKWRIIGNNSEEEVSSIKEWCDFKGINYKSFHNNLSKNGQSHGYKIEIINYDE